MFTSADAASILALSVFSPSLSATFLVFSLSEVCWSAGKVVPLSKETVGSPLGSAFVMPSLTFAESEESLDTALVGC